MAKKKVMSDMNTVALSGEVTKVVRKTDKVVMFGLKVAEVTPSNKTFNHHFTVKAFNTGENWAESFACVEEGDKITINGKLNTEKYNDKFTVVVVANAVDFE